MNGSYSYQGYVNIDLAQILRAHSEGMLRAFQMGQQLQVSIEAPVITANESAAGELFLGVFDQNSYGVYQNPQKYEESKPFWNTASCRQQTFDTYEEALAFARQGVAELTQMPVECVPPMQHQIDWRERIICNGGHPQ